MGKSLYIYSYGGSPIVVNAKIVEPYSPPSPNFKLSELQILNSASHLQAMGIASYKTSFSLLFNRASDYTQYMSNVGNKHRFIDERGRTFIGSAEEVRPKAYEANRRYLVEVTLLIIREDEYRQPSIPEIIDIRGTRYENDIKAMDDLGLLPPEDKDNLDPDVDRLFNPEDDMSRADFMSMLVRVGKASLGMLPFLR